MINKDYLLRMAEKVGRALATIMGLRKYNKDEEALILHRRSAPQNGRTHLALSQFPFGRDAGQNDLAS